MRNTYGMDLDNAGTEWYLSLSLYGAQSLHQTNGLDG